MRQCVRRAIRLRGETVEHDRHEAVGAVDGQRLLPEEPEQRPHVFGVEIVTQLTRARAGVEQ